MYAVKKKFFNAMYIIFAYSIFLSGCGVTDIEPLTVASEDEIETSMQVEETEVKPTKADEQIKVEEIKDKNNIYNAVKYYNDYLYFSDMDGFKRISKDQLITERLAEGNVRIGNSDGEYLYYIRYASDSAKNAGIFRMNLTEHVEEKLIEWSESMWSINMIYVCQNTIYFSGNGICEAYEMLDGKAEKMEEKNNMVYQKLDICGIPQSDISALAFGYISMMLQYHKLVYLDRQNHKIIVYDTESGQITDEIDQCGSDVLVSDRGIVYKDLENNILYKKWEADEPNVLYDIAEHDNRCVNFGTYDEQYVYGFYEDGEECSLIKIKWEGGCENDRTFKDAKIAVDLGFSVNDGVISFLQDGYRIFENN